jgi:hypothetical protein
MPWGISDRPFAIASPPLLTQVKTDATSLDQLKSRSSAERTQISNPLIDPELADCSPSIPSIGQKNQYFSRPKQDT